MSKLIYIGPDPAEVGVVPLPEGWGAFDHEETDEKLAKEKVASGMYKREGQEKSATADRPEKE
ncbi:MAG TPA: hypothetical protein VNL15_06105 [Dehalococcoidia bacterium]|nr:hypothetical protein [Dehalococcoidia bacterium]